MHTITGVYMPFVYGNLVIRAANRRVDIKKLTVKWSALS